MSTKDLPSELVCAIGRHLPYNDLVQYSLSSRSHRCILAGTVRAAWKAIEWSTKYYVASFVERCTYACPANNPPRHTDPPRTAKEDDQPLTLEFPDDLIRRLQLVHVDLHPATMQRDNRAGMY